MNLKKFHKNAFFLSGISYIIYIISNRIIIFNRGYKNENNR